MADERESIQSKHGKCAPEWCVLRKRVGGIWDNCRVVELEAAVETLTARVAQLEARLTQ